MEGKDCVVAAALRPPCSPHPKDKFTTYSQVYNRITWLINDSTWFQCATLQGNITYIRTSRTSSAGVGLCPGEMSMSRTWKSGLPTGEMSISSTAKLSSPCKQRKDGLQNATKIADFHFPVRNSSEKKYEFLWTVSTRSRLETLRRPNERPNLASS